MELKLVLEALLFSSQKPLAVHELRQVLVSACEQDGAEECTREFGAVTEQEIATALQELAREHELAQRSYRLVCIAGAWQFVTQPEYAPWLKAMLGVRPRPPRLSMPALETLAIIAYRQPITRAQIEQIRGVNVDGVMQTLLERGLVAPVGRAEVVGRPVLYGTTPLFLEYFGLQSLQDLPAADELRRPGSGEPAAAPSHQMGLATVPPAELAQAEPTKSEPGEEVGPPPCQEPGAGQST